MATQEDQHDAGTTAARQAEHKGSLIPGFSVLVAMAVLLVGILVEKRNTQVRARSTQVCRLLTWHVGMLAPCSRSKHNLRRQHTRYDDEALIDQAIDIWESASHLPTGVHDVTQLLH